MNNTQVGSYMTAFYFGYVITQIPAGMLADRLGVRWILGISLFIEAITTFAMHYITSYDMGFALRVVTGLGAGAVISSCLRALTEWFPVEGRVTAFGVLMAAPPEGIILANYIVPTLNNRLGWQSVFEVIGIVTAIVAILVLTLFRTSSNNVTSSGNVFGGLKAVLSNRNIIILALAGFCLMWAELGIATWANAYIKKLGYSVSAAGVVINVLITSHAGLKSSATAVGTTNFVFQMASMIAPLVLGWSIDFTGSFSSVWWILAAGPLLGAIILLPLGPVAEGKS
ncbi:MFS transporter [Desulfosporosinus fructosivorans]